MAVAAAGFREDQLRQWRDGGSAWDDEACYRLLRATGSRAKIDACKFESFVPSQPESSLGEAVYEPRRFRRLGPVTQVS